MKVDKRKKYVMVLDVETANSLLICTSFRCGKVHIPDTAEAVNAHESELSRRMVA